MNQSQLMRVALSFPLRDNHRRSAWLSPERTAVSLSEMGRSSSKRRVPCVKGESPLGVAAALINGRGRGGAERVRGRPVGAVYDRALPTSTARYDHGPPWKTSPRT